MKIKPVIFSLVVGLVVVALVGVYLASLEQKYVSQGKMVKVLVAKDYIPHHCILEESMAEPAEVPQKYFQPSALSSFKELVSQQGRPLYMTVVPVMIGEQIVATKLTRLGKSAGLSLIIPEEMRAISLEVDDETGVSKLIKPGDRVDVICTFTYEQKDKVKSKSTLLSQNVLVLAVGKNMLEEFSESGKEKTPSGEEDNLQTVTLALTPEQMLQVSYAKSIGRIQFALRPVGEIKILPVPEVTLGSILKEESVNAIRTSAGAGDTTSIIRGIQEEIMHNIKR